jgi:hypothetical protein
MIGPLYSKFPVDASSVRLHRPSHVRCEPDLVMFFARKNSPPGSFRWKIYLHDRSLHVFHLWGETRSQLSPPYSIISFIGIRTRPDTHECFKWFPRLMQVNIDASRPHRSSSMTNMGAFGLWCNSSPSLPPACDLGS